MPQNLTRLPTSRWRTTSLSHHPRSKGGGHPHRSQGLGLGGIQELARSSTPFPVLDLG